MTLFTIVAERIVVARMQQRIGPNRVGPRGSLQTLADGVKLMLKEDIIPALVDKPVFILAPIIVAVPAFLAFAWCRSGPNVSIDGHQTALQLTDLPVGVLFVLALLVARRVRHHPVRLVERLDLPAAGLAALGGAGHLVRGRRWACRWSRSSSTRARCPPAGSCRASRITGTSGSLPVSFIIYVICMVGETNRAPFDLPEAESELVGGFHTEY